MGSTTPGELRRRTGPLHVSQLKMSEARFRGLGAPELGAAAPMAAWQLQVASAKERVAHLRAPAVADRGRDAPENMALDELLLSMEELSVAEEELRSQNDELERTRALVYAERERYRALFEHAPVAYFVTDRYGGIVDVNRAAADLVRCRHRDELRRKPLLVFVQDASRRRVRRVLTQLSADRPVATIRFNLRSRSARVRRVEATIAVSFDREGKVGELRWLILDQTRRLRRERERRADAAELKRLVVQRTAELERAQRLKDQLIATVSHEFRTALSAIGGYAELLEMGVRGPVSDLQLADIRRIHAAYHHLTGIVEDLLSYSRLSAGTLTPELDDVNLQDVVLGLVDLVGPQAAKAGIALHFGELPARTIVRVDAERARQVLLNLLSNAVKFTPAGGLVALDAEADTHGITVRVTDTGPGIPHGDMESVFQPFVRLRSATPGTGLGLAISRDLARAMGGDLFVDAEHCPGSCFVLRLPRSTSLAPDSASG